MMNASELPLPDQLITQGAILAHLRRFDEARKSFNRAIEVGEMVSDFAAVGRAGLELDRIINVVSLAEARARTFIWQMSGDSMSAAGVRAGRCYRFRRTRKWQDGDIVAVTTPHGRPYICYIESISNGVRLFWGDLDCQPECYLRSAITVQGVIDI